MRALFPACIAALPAAAGAYQDERETQGPRVVGRIEVQGIAIEASVTPLEPSPTDALVEGQQVRVAFRIADTATGAPQTTLRPAAWLHPADEEQPCEDKVRGFLSGGIVSRADVDLNVFYVVALNGDATLSVVDPLFGYGGSKLLALVELASPGEDWVLSADRTRLFVSEPLAQSVAVVDPSTWTVAGRLETGPRPVRVALQPDERYLWVGCDGDDGDGDAVSGVSVFDALTHERVAHVPTGAGHHELAFSPDSRFAFVTNEDAGTLSVIDVWTMKIERTFVVGRRPVSVAVSPLSGAAYVVDADAGEVHVHDATSLAKIATIDVEPGVGELSFDPSGRLGFLPNPDANTVDIIDSSAHRVVQTADVGVRPDQVTFTDTLAYVRSLGSELVWMIPIDQVGVEGRPVPIIEFSGGQAPFGLGSGPATAEGIVAAPGGTAVLVPNPADGAIYYYREGMAAPMGHYKNYGREPRAAMVVDRSLQEIEPGLYATDVELRSAGTLDLTFFVDAPRIAHCFSVAVEPDPELEAARAGRLRVKLEPLADELTVDAGAPLRVRVRVTDAATGVPRLDLADVGLLAFHAGGWQERHRLAHAGAGVYETSLTLPDRGSYYLFFRCPSQEVEYADVPPRVVRALEAEPAEQPAGAER